MEMTGETINLLRGQKVVSQHIWWEVWVMEACFAVDEGPEVRGEVVEEGQEMGVEVGALAEEDFAVFDWDGIFGGLYRCYAWGGHVHWTGSVC